MLKALRELQVARGAILSNLPVLSDLHPAAMVGDVPVSFGNEPIAYQAAQTGVAICDRSHWGRLEISGSDRIRFLHNQSTNHFEKLQPGQGCDTVFVSPTARTIDLVTAYVLEESVWLITSPGYNQKLLQWMDRFIFFADKVILKDLTETTAMFTLLGPQSEALLQQLGVSLPIGSDKGTHHLIQMNGVDLRIAIDSGLSTPGYTMILPGEAAVPIWQVLTEAGAVPLGEQGWEQLRIEQGRPVPGQELTEDYNPLEVGLWQAISLSKGCYIGQEVIARLHTYRGVKQQLWGVRLTAPAPLESPVMAEGEKVGKLTSLTQTSNGYFGLAYIRTKAIDPALNSSDLKIQVADSPGELVALPFVSHEYI